MLTENGITDIPIRTACKKMSLETKLSLLGDIDITYPRMNRIFSAIQRSRYMSKFHNKANNILVYGKTGVGKTYICEKIVNQNPRVEGKQNEDPEIPVLMVRVENFATVKSLVFKFLVTLGDPVADKGPEYVQSNRFNQLVKACNVELIIIDEVHHFLDMYKNSEKSIKKLKPLRPLINWVKVKSDETRIPFVLVGIEEAIAILEKEEEGQLSRRFKNRKHLEAFKFDDKPNQNEFYTLLCFIDEKLPFQKDSAFLDGNLPAKIFYATDGIIDHVLELITYASEIALLNGDDRVISDHLALSYNETLEALMKKQNPFSKGKYYVILQKQTEKLQLATHT